MASLNDIKTYCDGKNNKNFIGKIRGTILSAWDGEGSDI